MAWAAGVTIALPVNNRLLLGCPEARQGGAATCCISLRQVHFVCVSLVTQICSDPFTCILQAYRGACAHVHADILILLRKLTAFFERPTYTIHVTLRQN